MNKKYVFPYANKNGECHDCGVLPGQYHHDGCDVERCPFLFKQRISCDCPKCEKIKLIDKVPFGFEVAAIRKLAKKEG